jgi:hypothetical protein
MRGGVVSAETLRRAAALMREQHGPEHVRHEMWSAMAALLDDAAENQGLFDTGDLSFEHDSIMRRLAYMKAFAVARAYLGSES